MLFEMQFLRLHQKAMDTNQQIHQRIFEIRGDKVMLDFDLAQLYEVSTKVINQAVKRNILRFPPDFMFQLTIDEWNKMRSQFVTASQSKRNQAVTPYAFTEQGIAMLSGVLRSQKAINVHVALMRAFVELRKMILEDGDTRKKLRQLKKRVDKHDLDIAELEKEILGLIDEVNGKENWDSRDRIGYHQNKN